MVNVTFILKYSCFFFLLILLIPKFSSSKKVYFKFSSKLKTENTIKLFFLCLFSFYFQLNKKKNYFFNNRNFQN